MAQSPAVDSRKLEITVPRPLPRSIVSHYVRPAAGTTIWPAERHLLSCKPNVRQNTTCSYRLEAPTVTSGPVCNGTALHGRSAPSRFRNFARNKMTGLNFARNKMTGLKAAPQHHCNKVERV